jgi:hypothetical protein
VLFAWTGDPRLSRSMAPVLAMYAAGNGVMAVAGMPYFLLCAQGNPRADTVGMLILALVLVPSMALAVATHGGNGAAFTWLSAMTLYLFAWTPIVHRGCDPSLHRTWLLRDVGLTLAPGLLIFCILHFVATPVGRWEIAIYVLFAAAAAMGANVASSPLTRRLGTEMLGRTARRPQ